MISRNSRLSACFLFALKDGGKAAVVTKKKLFSDRFAAISFYPERKRTGVSSENAKGQECPQADRAAECKEMGTTALSVLS